MTAVLRSVKASTLSGSSATASRGDARTGDILIAFQAADSGGNSAMSMPGWNPIGSQPGGLWSGSSTGFWAGVRVWMRVCEDGEPTSYPVFQGPVAAGVVTIAAIAGGVAGTVVALGSGGTTTAPDMNPISASGLQLRFAAGVPELPGASVTWSAPTGYVEQVEAQASTWTSSVLASAPVVSSLPVGLVTLAPSLFLPAVAFTVLIESQPIQVPEPPQYPPFTPGKGSSRYRYVIRNLLTREYLGDLDLDGVTFDARIGQPGAFQATIPIPTRKVGDQVAEIIPRGETDIGIGPGVITCEIYRSGDCWGEYWITGAGLRRGRDGTPTVQLRGSTLDAYLAHVELQAFLGFAGQDQIEIARNLLTHAMAQPYTNIGLVLQAGVSGVLRDRLYQADESTYGQRLQELAEVEDGFEWAVRTRLIDGSIVRRWEWGYPVLGQQNPPLHVFADGRSGGDILEWTEDIDALRGATRWRARGSTVDGDASTVSQPAISTVHEATDHLAAGWPRLDRTINKSTVTELSTLEEWAAYWAATAPGALRVNSLTIALGAEPTFTPHSVGDTARIYLNNEWHRGVWRTRRIIGIAITPTSKTEGIEEAQLILEGRDVE